MSTTSPSHATTADTGPTQSAGLDLRCRTLLRRGGIRALGHLVDRRRATTPGPVGAAALDTIRTDTDHVGEADHVPRHHH